MENEQPLAYRMRPNSIDEVIGQKHILGKDKMLYRMIKANRLRSIILYGPPGTGKTSIAHAIACTTDLPFEEINAVSSGKKDMEKVVKVAQERKQAKKEALEAITEETSEDEKERIEAMPSKTILFVDEIHRFNKTQQDYLLPFVESGLIILIGATTENPYFEILPAIRSRSQIFQLKLLTVEDIVEALNRALKDEERGLGEYKVEAKPEALEHLASACGGDIRSALNGLELAVLSTEPNEEGVIVVTLEEAEQSIQQKSFGMDKGGDNFYNLLSAFQKSIRGSDTDAALHYLARMLEGFGDLKTINRRLAVIAFEDISIADPSVFSAVMAAIDCSERVGMPEARIPLANAVILLCLSPKTNSAYKALDVAIADVRAGNVGDIPDHLKDTHYASAKQLGSGVGYRYPHDYNVGSFGSWIPQQYLPYELAKRSYFTPKEAGQEKQLGAIYHKLKESQNKK